jgi:hypothetical protein
MGAYVIDDDGVLARHPMSASEELRPNAGAGERQHEQKRAA